MAEETLEDVRSAIDDVDRELVALLAERQRLVAAAAVFKTDAESVRGAARRAAMMVDRRGWALELGLDVRVLEAVFGAMVDAFVALELERVERRSSA
jgi:isochorismate pyruvate lyase